MSSCVVEESCAVAMTSIDEAKRRNVLCVDSVNSIVLLMRRAVYMSEWAKAREFHSPRRQARAGAESGLHAREATGNRV